MNCPKCMMAPMYYCEDDRWYCRNPSCDGEAMFTIDELLEDMKKDLGQDHEPSKISHEYLKGEVVRIFNLMSVVLEYHDDYYLPDGFPACAEIKADMDKLLIALGSQQ